MCDGLKKSGIGQSATKSNYIVYKLTNTLNGKAYIGISSRPLSYRWSEHKERARQGVRNSRLYAALRKYGFDAFTKEVIAFAESEESLRILEREYIEKHDTFNSGYNSNPGGHGFIKFPDHIRLKISEAQKGKIISSETRAKMSSAKKGDKIMASRFGGYLNKGAKNPRCSSMKIRTPNGEEIIVRGIREFCRNNNIQLTHLYSRGRSKGYVVLERLND